MDKPDAGSPLDGIESLTQLRERHVDLLDRWTADNPSTDEAEALRTAAQALGAWLDDPEDRDRAQGIIDYWTATLSAVPDRAFPQLLRLDSFDEMKPRALAAEAEALWQRLDASERDAAETILLQLLALGRRGNILVSAPVPRARLIQEDASEAGTQALRRLVGAGLVRSGGKGRFDFTHASVARRWPRLATLLGQQREANQTRDRLLATAEQWKLHDENPGYLLTGTVLDQAKLHLGHDETLDAFILRSSHSRDRTRRWWQISLTAGSAALGLVYFAVYDISFDQGVSFEDLKQIVSSETRTKNLDEALEEEEQRPPTPVIDAPSSLGRVGFIWAGNAETRLLRDNRTRQVADPATIHSGQTLLLRAHVALRDSSPPDDERAGRQIGNAPAGARVVVLSERPAIQRRPSGDQYWIQVRVVPLVFIQYVHGGSEQIRSLETRLREAGFDVQPSELTRNAVGFRELRFFYSEDGSSASRLRTTTTGAVGPVGCRRMTSPGALQSNLELWIDFRLSPPASTQQSPSGDC